MVGGVGGTVGIILAGGRGERAKPITLESADYIRSKALIPFAGRRLIEWVVDACRVQGVRRFFVVAQGLENRQQIKLLLGHGERYGVEIQYSRARFDRYNVGSGAATLHNLEQWDLGGQALVLPVDSIFEFSLGEMLAAHRGSGALVTVGAVERSAGEVAGKYGVMRTGPGGLVEGFVEKPSLARIGELFPESVAGGLLPTNAGMYVVDCDRLRRVGRDLTVMRMAQQRLDWGGDFLPWQVAQGLPVGVHRIGRLGDLGNVEDYLRTLADVLGGGYPQMDALMGEPVDRGRRCWIDESSLRMRDLRAGTTLAQKIEEGSVVIGPGVRIGRDVEIGPGVHLEYADVGDGVEVREGVRLSRAALGDSSVVGPYAQISDSYLGPMTQVQSERRRPVRLEAFTALGDGVQVWPGTELSRVSVYPRLDLPPVTNLPPGTSITSTEDLLQWA